MEQRQHQELGSYIRECRESLGHSVDDVAENLNIRVRYIEFIELGEFDSLPGTVYTEGYLKSYARFLEIDHSDILKKYRNAKNNNMEEQEVSLPEIMGERHIPKKWVLVSSVAVLLVTYAIWDYLGKQNTISNAEFIESSPLTDEDIMALKIRSGKETLSNIDSELLDGLDSDSQYVMPESATPNNTSTPGASSANDEQSDVKEVKILGEPSLEPSAGNAIVSPEQ